MTFLDESHHGGKGLEPNPHLCELTKWLLQTSPSMELNECRSRRNGMVAIGQVKRSKIPGSMMLHRNYVE